MKTELPHISSIRDENGKREYNRLMFGVIAAEYDFITRALSFGRDSSWKKELIAALPVSEIEHAVDLACGTGDIALQLTAKYPGAKITGLDLSPQMIALARKRNGGSRVEFREGDMIATGLPDACANIVTGGYALRNAPNLAASLREIFRILKPGGTAAFLDFSKSAAPAAQKISIGAMRCWGGFWGLLLHRNPAMYTYIADSLALFPDRETLREKIAAAGFVNQRGNRHFAGLIEITICDKPGAGS